MPRENAVPINMRAHEEQRNLIDRGARAAHKSRTEFVLEAATRAAQEVLLSQNRFVLDEADYQAFLDTLGQPVGGNEALVRLLETTPPWES